jgi:formylglycine-generating enzyme required for sulfatase activity
VASSRIVLVLLAACATSRDEGREIVTDAPGEAPPGMVWIPGGRFRMGGAGPHALPAERPVHDVEVDGFFMDVHAVTNARFRAFVEATGYVTVAERAPDSAAIMRQLSPGASPPPRELLVPGALTFVPKTGTVDLRDWSQWWRFTPGASWRHPDGPGSSIDGKDDHPVVQVAWEDAVAFATWAGRRLPTEAEWEFGARGGAEQREHAWGDAPLDSAKPQAHVYAGVFPSHPAAPARVGSFPPNAHGLRDMSGNVWQWTHDWYDERTYVLDAARGVVRNPTGPASLGASARVLRGGSFLCSDSYCRGYRVSARSPGAPDTGGPHIGFRTVMSVDQWRAWRATAGDRDATSR